jgi:hypothetical protein
VRDKTTTPTPTLGRSGAARSPGAVDCCSPSSCGFGEETKSFMELLRFSQMGNDFEMLLPTLL